MQERAIERRRNPNGKEHRNAAKKVKKALRKARRKCYRKVLNQTEEAQRSGNYNTVYANIKKVSKKTNKPGIGIKDPSGNMIHEKDEIKKRRQSYCAELFCRGDLVREDMNKEEEEPKVLEAIINSKKQDDKQSRNLGERKQWEWMRCPQKP